MRKLEVFPGKPEVFFQKTEIHSKYERSKFNSGYSRLRVNGLKEGERLS